jgi:hypothetical protein
VRVVDWQIREEKRRIAKSPLLPEIENQEFYLTIQDFKG